MEGGHGEVEGGMGTCSSSGVVVQTHSNRWVCQSCRRTNTHSQTISRLLLLCVVFKVGTVMLQVLGGALNRRQNSSMAMLGCAGCQLRFIIRADWLSLHACTAGDPMCQQYIPHLNLNSSTVHQRQVPQLERAVAVKAVGLITAHTLRWPVGDRSTY